MEGHLIFRKTQLVIRRAKIAISSHQPWFYTIDSVIYRNLSGNATGFWFWTILLCWGFLPSFRGWCYRIPGIALAHLSTAPQWKREELQSGTVDGLDNPSYSILRIVFPSHGFLSVRVWLNGQMVLTQLPAGTGRSGAGQAMPWCTFDDWSWASWARWVKYSEVCLQFKLSLDVLKHFLTSDHWSFQGPQETDSKWSRPLKALGTSNQADEVGTSREIFRVQRKGMGWLGGLVGMCQDCECWTILNIEATMLQEA